MLVQYVNRSISVTTHVANVVTSSMFVLFVFFQISVAVKLSHALVALNFWQSFQVSSLEVTFDLLLVGGFVRAGIAVIFSESIDSIKMRLYTKEEFSTVITKLFGSSRALSCCVLLLQVDFHLKIHARFEFAEITIEDPVKPVNFFAVIREAMNIFGAMWTLNIFRWWP